MVPAVALEGITKIYPGVIANQDVDWTLEWGQIHALLGENGAGKSTLMNILYGMTVPDSGRIVLEGREVRIGSPSEAIRLGIGMVHQHFQLVGSLTVAQNVLMGMEPRRFGLVDTSASHDKVRALADQVGLPIDPAALVEDLPVGLQQRVEILKVLARDARILIFDEPTAVLTPQEIALLGQVMQRLAAEGKALVFITHKMREVQAIATHVTVMRAGRKVGVADPRRATAAELAALVVGRPLKSPPETPPSAGGATLLQVQDVSCRSARGLEALRGVSLEVKAGEIVGLIGVEGNGQSELVEVIAGLRPVSAGRILLAPRGGGAFVDLTRATPGARRTAGVGHVAEDRLRRAVIKSWSIADNLVFDRFHQLPYAKAGRLDHETIRQRGATMLARYRIKAPDAQTPVGSLSGGNQQKVVMARELDDRYHVLLIAQPTRGVDAGAAEAIHDEMRALRDRGAGVLLVTNELDELLAMSDRIGVVYHGEIVAWRARGTVTREELGRLMIGGRQTGELGTPA
ncbi:MAG: ABC transporter ATP-binding protein [Candidatus Sericytochromatia bacterium]|nr:ABC transporter ATP-binding protein [Candidatus Sericytochromatia bacterium]